MKKGETEMQDELRPEYALVSLPVRKLGPWRKSFGGPAVLVVCKAFLLENLRVRGHSYL